MTTEFFAAGSWKQRHHVHARAQRIVEATGRRWRCLSRWHDPNNGWSHDPQEFVRKNWYDLELARRLVFFGGLPFSTGKHVELGFALGRGYPIHAIMVDGYDERCSTIPKAGMMTLETYLVWIQRYSIADMDQWFKERWTRLTGLV